MPYVVINYWAVLVAGIVAMVIGFLWYGPIFGKSWMKLMGMNAESMKGKKNGMGGKYLVMFIGTLIAACVLADWVDGVQGGFWVWLGFYATQQIGSVLWEGRSTKLFTLNTLHSLVSLVVVGAILASWN